MEKQINVVGAIVVLDGKILCARRGSTGPLPGMWEFPGGKIEQGETHAMALEREILEELGCTIVVGEKVVTTSHLYEFGTVTLTTYFCKLLERAPQRTEHDSLVWLLPGDLNKLEWAAADIPAVEAVQMLFASNV